MFTFSLKLIILLCVESLPFTRLFGLDQKLSQLEDNIGAMGWRLSAAEIRMLKNETDRSGLMFEGAGYKRTSEKFVGYGVEKWSLD